MAKIGGALTQLVSRAAREMVSEATDRVKTEVKNQVRAEVRSRLGVPDGMRTSAAIKGEAARMIRQGTADKLSALSARLGAARASRPAQPAGPSSLDLGAAYQAVRAGLGSEVARHVLTQVVPAGLERAAARLAGGSAAPAAMATPRPAAAQEPSTAGGEADAGATTAAHAPQAEAGKAEGALTSATLHEPFSDPDLPHGPGPAVDAHSSAKEGAVDG